MGLKQLQILNSVNFWSQTSVPEEGTPSSKHMLNKFLNSVTNLHLCDFKMATLMLDLSTHRSSFKTLKFISYL